MLQDLQSRVACIILRRPMPETDSTALYSAILIAVQVLAVGGAAWLLLFPEHVAGASSSMNADAEHEKSLPKGGIDWRQGAENGRAESRQPR